MSVLQIVLIVLGGIAVGALITLGVVAWMLGPTLEIASAVFGAFMGPDKEERKGRR